MPTPESAAHAVVPVEPGDVGLLTLLARCRAAPGPLELDAAARQELGDLLADLFARRRHERVMARAALLNLRMAAGPRPAAGPAVGSLDQ